MTRDAEYRLLVVYADVARIDDGIVVFVADSAAVVERGAGRVVVGHLGGGTDPMIADEVVATALLGAVARTIDAGS